jgi:N-acetylglucosaminyl-diphospho-decaprenol L-rhamnosyltransferase
MRGEALERAGLLDEAFFMYGEDLDLCYRIKALGWRVVYNPSVVVLHVKGAASRQASRRSINAFYDAMRVFHDKHYRARSAFLVNGLVDLGIGVMRAVALTGDRMRPSGRKRVASA